MPSSRRGDTCLDLLVILEHVCCGIKHLVGEGTKSEEVTITVYQTSWETLPILDPHRLLTHRGREGQPSCPLQSASNHVSRALPSFYAQVVFLMGGGFFPMLDSPCSTVMQPLRRKFSDSCVVVPSHQAGKVSPSWKNQAEGPTGTDPASTASSSRRELSSG